MRRLGGGEERHQLSVQSVMGEMSLRKAGQGSQGITLQSYKEKAELLLVNSGNARAGK